MKKYYTLFFLIATVLTAAPVFAQKYKTAADTVKLNIAYAKLAKQVADLAVKLADAQQDLPVYQAKAKEAEKDAAAAMEVSSEQASKANNGKLSDAKKAKRKAGKAYGNAKAANAAVKKADEIQHKINRYQADLTKKQQGLQDLESMRTAIYNGMLSPAPAL